MDVTDEYKTILGILDSASNKYANKTALVCDKEELTYDQVSKLSIQLADFFIKKGLIKGDVIALVMPNILAYPITLFAAFRLGLTVVNINPMYTFSEIESVASNCHLKAVVVFAPMLENIINLPSFKQFKSVISVAPGPLKMTQSIELPEGISHFSDALDIGNESIDLDDRYLKEPLDVNDIAFLQYTGGTTGLPKAAMLSHHNIITCVKQFQSMTEYIEPGNEVVLAPLPLYHIFGLVVGLLSSF